MKYKEITEKIIGVFYEVYNEMGSGFLEKVYENAMLVEFKRLGIRCQNQCPIEVGYKGRIVGDYIADFVVEDKVVVGHVWHDSGEPRLRRRKSFLLLMMLNC